jgi:hypothetical protein
LGTLGVRGNNMFSRTITTETRLKTPPHRKDITSSSLYPVMKPGNDSKKSNDNSMTPPDKDGEGMGALMILQIVAGIICAILVVWILFHSILHII